MKYIRNSPWLDISLKLNPRIDDRMSEWSQNIEMMAGGSGRSDAIRNVGNALSVISANILKNYSIFPELNLQIDLSNNGYPKGPFNPYRISTSSLRKVFYYLRDSDLNLIESTGGNYNRSTGFGYPTQIRATNYFLDLLFNIIEKEIPKGYGNQPITRKTFCYSSYINHSPEVFCISSVPALRLREGSSKASSNFIQFRETDETRRMEENINRYNSFLGNHWIDIFITDSDFISLQSVQERSFDEFGTAKNPNPPVDLVSGCNLYRVFNDGTFDHGGRFYGGWWQNIPSGYRRFITIDSVPTVEVDFSSMQIAMLYAIVGHDLEGDAYAIDGISPKYRDLIKATAFKLINGTGRLRAPERSRLPEGVTWEELQKAVSVRHRLIADYLGSGEGIRLQRLDSDIAEDVIMEMLGRGVVALPIHDSFIVPEGNGDELQAVMLTAYKRRMGGRTIGLKEAPSLFDDLLADQTDLTAMERHRLGMARFQAKKEAPEYNGYRKREECAGPRGSSEQLGRDHPAWRLDRVGDRSKAAVRAI